MEIDTEKQALIKVGITIGDVNGIGPEIILKALRDARILKDFTPIIYGSEKVLSHYQALLEMDDFSIQICKNASQALENNVNVVNVWTEEVELSVGQGTEKGGLYAFKALEAATQDISEGKIDVLVTAPFSKDGMIKAGFKFPGHTEYLADLSAVKEALMILVSPTLKVALVTSHIPIKEISKKLSKDLIIEKIKAFEQSLKKDFNLTKPKIAVFGLNPHAGENGKLGTEESETIQPAIQFCKAEGILAFGPFAADGYFGSPARNQYDGVLAMYHDQGLAAFKALSFDDGVNFTAGLPIVRTSPDHGTAFDIAGKNCASEQSFRSAIYIALDVFRTRKFQKLIHANPLPFTPEDKSKKNSSRDE